MTAHTPTHASEGSAYAKKCKAFIDKRHIKAEQLHFSECVHTAADAIRLIAAKADAKGKGKTGKGGAANALVVVKTVVLAARYAIGPEGVEETHFIACILRGDKKVDMGAMRDVLGTGRVKTATRDEVLEQTGYPAGGVPPFGHNLSTYIDDEAMELTDVIAGGGSDRALIKTTMKEIAAVTQAHVARIAKR